MLKLEMKTSPRMVQQIAAIERFAGAWDRLSQSDAVASDSLLETSLRAGAESCFRLDSSSPPGLSAFIEIESTHADGSVEARPDLEVGSNPLRALRTAHVSSFEFELDEIKELYAQLVAEPGGAKVDSSLRRSPVHFTAPELGTRGDEVVFPTVSPFLVDSRMNELLEWTRHELEDGVFHPLFIIGTFHLLFLQISPFPKANHRLALILLWRLLDSHGYSFVRFRHFAPELENRSKQYFSALRQAEKTASGNWATLNVWLEFFLDTLVLNSSYLLELSQKKVSTARLTLIQKRIMEIIKTNGSATRERIVTETGINLSTVKYNLSVLASRGHLKRDGGGRSTSYRVL